MMTDQTPDAAPTPTADARAPKEPRAPQYVGPRYKTGLIMPDGRTIRPRRSSREEAKAIVERYPHTAGWFRPAP